MSVKEYLQQPEFQTVEEERQHGKKRLAAAFRLFGRFGFSEGTAGHMTYRDPEHEDHFWVNPYGMSFNTIRVSDLVLVNDQGEEIEGEYAIQRPAFAIHAAVHKARPDVRAAVHAHSVHGKTWAALGRLLDPLTQDACAFYEDHALFDDFTGVVYESEEGERIAEALGKTKAAILKNHGLLTVGETVDSAVFWFITMERSCQAQLMAEATGRSLQPIDAHHARLTYEQTGQEIHGWEGFQPLYEWIVREQPDLLD